MKQQAWRDVIGFFFLNCCVYYKMGRKNERFITSSIGGPHDSIIKRDVNNITIKQMRTKVFT